MVNADIAYLLGALRDANIDIRTGKNYEIKFVQKNFEWLQLIQSIIKNNFGVNSNIHGDLLRLTNKRTVEQIQKISEIVSPQGVWETPTVIKKSNDNIAISYIQGFWDAEGGLPKDPKNSSLRYLSFDQKNKEALIFIKEKLEKLGLKPTRLYYTSSVWQFRIHRKLDIIKFEKLIGSRHPEKSKRLSALTYSLFP